MTFFAEALQSDVADIQHGTTSEGVHLGAMAGTVDLVQRVSTGIEVKGDVLRLNPELAPEVECLDMLIRYRGHSIDLRLTHDALTVRRDVWGFFLGLIGTCALYLAYAWIALATARGIITPAPEDRYGTSSCPSGTAHAATGQRPHRAAHGQVRQDPLVVGWPFMRIWSRDERTNPKHKIWERNGSAEPLAG